MFIVNGDVVSQQVEHSVCRCKVGVTDRRKNTTVEKLTVYFDVRADFDGSDGYIKATVEKIVRTLGYSYVGPMDWEIADYSFDAEKKFAEIREYE